MNEFTYCVIIMYVAVSDDPNVMLVVTVQGDGVYRIKQFV